MFGLQAIATSFIKLLPQIRKDWVVKRDDLIYKLDLTKTIDFEIFLGGWEKQTLTFLKNNLNNYDCVIEVGANIGAHTLLMSKLVGNKGCIYAIEPTKFALEKLKKNLSLNPSLSNVKIIECLISNYTSGKDNYEKVILNSDWSRNGNTSPEILIAPKIMTIDELVNLEGLTRLNLLKIDVDGYDLRVLQGSVDTLIKFKPMIFCELCEYALNSKGDSIDGIFKLLRSLNYACFDEVNGAPLSALEAKKLAGKDTSINAIFKSNAT